MCTKRRIWVRFRCASLRDFVSQNELTTSIAPSKMFQIPIGASIKNPYPYRTSYHTYMLLSNADIPLHKYVPVKMRLPTFQARRLLMMS